MAKDQRTSTLPSSDEFWKMVDNDPTREYLAACVFEKIRNSNLHTDNDRVAFVASLKLLVELMDSPRETFNAITLSKIEEEERKELEEAL